ncbi:MAG: DUF488 domain-containing protein [Thermoproteales archaeon]|nr:DUF488 domain-containing protein [Thermoproteales archaeon]
MTMIIYTIGHSNRDLYEFIRILKHYKIEIVVDVRRWPSSKKFPHFNEENLKKELEKFDVKYFWLGDLLGGYRKEGYEKYMSSENYNKGILKLEELIKENKIVIMCGEKLWFRCHRRYISDTLVERGYKVIHIIERNRTQEHKLRKPNY